MKRNLILIGLIAVVLGATGCESVRKAVGNQKSAPDEFVVYKRPPLTLPPEFGLRPPQPGADTAAALEDWGISQADVASLLESGAVWQRS